MKNKNNGRNAMILAGTFAMAGGVFGVMIGGIVEHSNNDHKFNKAAEDIKERTMQVSADTLYTKDGKIGDIRRDTTYVVTKKDFEQLSPKFK